MKRHRKISKRRHCCLTLSLYRFINNQEKTCVSCCDALKGELILAQITVVKRGDEDLISLTKKDFATGFLKHDSFTTPSIYLAL